MSASERRPLLLAEGRCPRFASGCWRRRCQRWAAGGHRFAQGLLVVGGVGQTGCRAQCRRRAGLVNEPGMKRPTAEWAPMASAKRRAGRCPY